MGLKKPLRTDNGSATLVFRIFSTVRSDKEDAVPESKVENIDGRSKHDLSKILRTLFRIS